jgi:energy-coupling factor transporter ATP-binding protein EcfA2
MYEMSSLTPSDTSFAFMGRESFYEVWNTWTSIKREFYHRQRMHIYGSMGFGKSHILAALACLLIRHGERVIYIPDCGDTYQNPLSHMRAAFLLAFADSLSDTEHILRWKSLDEICTFCDEKNQGSLSFIVDQLNALDPVDENKYTNNPRRAEFTELLQSCTLDHLYITSASANVDSYKITKRNHRNDVKVSLIGGMTRVRHLGCTCWPQY